MSIFKGPSFTNKADKIDKISATVADFGLPVAYIFGTSKIGSNLIEYFDFESIERRTTTKSGKAKSTQIDYDYYSKIVLALAHGSANNQIGAVWVGGNKYGSLGTLNSSGAEGSGLTFIANGGKPYTQQYNDLSMCYGRCFLGKNNASVPSVEFELKGLLRSTTGGDANPADVIKFLLQEIGLEDYIDDISWQDYKRFCKNAGLFVSTPRDYFGNQKKAQEIVKELLTLTNTFMFWSVDKFKFKPCYPAVLGDWVPDLTIQYDLSEKDFLKNSFGFKRKDSSQQFNVVKVNFSNRANDYEKESISFVNTDEVQRVGVKQTEIDATWIHNKESAVKLAKMLAEKYANEVTEYNFKLDWAYCRLEPSDLVRISNKTLNINEVVRIKEVTEDKEGNISVTATSTPIEAYGQAQYTVRNDYEYIDYNVSPGNTDTPLFIIPPSDLVTSNAGVELWIALRGTTNKWGGCTVHASYDDLTYAEAGTQPLESLYGVVLQDNGSNIRVRLGNVSQKELISNQLVWINGEVLQYETATLTAFNTYTLNNCQRGLHGTSRVTHQANEQFAILDSSLFCVQLNKSDIGKTMYFKFPSFNMFKTMGEDINQLDSYAVTITLADLPNCTNIRAYNKYRELSDDVTRYDIEVLWDVPNMDSYSQAQVWYKTSGTQADEIGVIREGVVANDIGFEGKWLFGGQGYNAVTIPQAIIGDRYKIAVCTQDIYGNVETPAMSPQVELLVAMKTETPNTPANLGVGLTDTFNISWDEVRNADIKYYEVRTDRYVGVDSPALIVRTTENKYSTTSITNRQGTIYVFSVSAYDKVSAPATVEYSFPVPQEPTITCTSKLAGIECVAQSIPNNCIGIHWFFDGTDSDNDITTEGTTYFYQANAGVYEISACYVDYFGDGTVSGNQTVTIQAYIDETLIKSESISFDKLSKETQKAIDEGGLDTVNIAVKGMLGEGSALTLLPSGELGLVASNGQVLTGLFANQDGVIRLQGQYTHITGDTQIDGNVITNNMIAGGITADKLNVTSLNAISGNFGTFTSTDGNARCTINGGLILVESFNSTLNRWVTRVKLGLL